MALAKKQPKRIQYLIASPLGGPLLILRQKKFIGLILTIFMFICVFAPIKAYALPNITWVSEALVNTENPNDGKRIIFLTPLTLGIAIDSYEYKINDGSWQKVADGEGAEIIIQENCTLYLRYFSNSTASEEFIKQVVVFTPIYIEDLRTGIILEISSGSGLPDNIGIASYEIIEGVDYNNAAMSLEDAKPLVLYDINLIYQNEIFDFSKNVIWKLPVPEGFTSSFCKVYYLDSNSKAVAMDTSLIDDKLVFTTNLTGLFFIVDEGSFKGDVDGDGKITAADARLALRAAAKLTTLTKAQLEAADLTNDGRVTAEDARKILRVAAKLETI